MSAITAPSTSYDSRRSTRTPHIVGAAAVGILALGAVVVPRLTTTTTTTTPTVTVNQHDAVEHQLDSTTAQKSVAAANAQSRAVQQRLDRQARQRAAAAVTAPAGVTALVRQQVGGMAPTFTWSPDRVSSLQQQQTGGHATYPYTGGMLHTTWTDRYVPPVDNPEWVPFIKKHYFSSTVTPTRPTHEFH